MYVLGSCGLAALRLECAEYMAYGLGLPFLGGQVGAFRVWTLRRRV